MGNSSQSSQIQNTSFPELNSDDEFKPAQGEIEVKTENEVEIDNVVDLKISEDKSKEDTVKDIGTVPETKKSKMSKKKNKNNPDAVTCSSADESKEVEVK